jgi:hypothetical protein
MTWWALLFAFSMMARYEPVAWTASLDLDKTETAPLLQLVLDTGLKVVPRLVLDALVGPR